MPRKRPKRLFRNRHTPGPWVIAPAGPMGCIPIREGPDGYLIATVWADDSGLERRDARLVAASPDLLEACEIAASALDDMAAEPELGIDPMEIVRDVLVPAILKAGGRIPPTHTHAADCGLLSNRRCDCPPVVMSAERN